GDYDMDADMANHREARAIGNTAIGKAFWLLLFPIFQAQRPPRIKYLKLTTKWTKINFVVILIFDILIFWLFGGQALVYLIASTFFAVGLHPLGARWIQEHYIVAPPQETYSYYGILNTVALNVGYHNEHHDFPSVPWNKLPKIREYAPEYYNNLVYHTSWTKLLFKFLFDPKLSLYSRIERVDKGKKEKAYS
ncbi:MAG: fatty acid desaturase, partial [Flavobacteriales bacterium]